MLTFTLKRLVWAGFVMAGVLITIFLVMRVVPGDPALVLLGPNASDNALVETRAKLGLDKPLVVQLLDYMSAATTLDFGTSIRGGRDAMSSVLDRVPATAQLACAAVVLALAISFPLGIAASIKPNGVIDRLISILSLTGQSAPSFWVGLMLILIFSRTFQLLPSSGSGGIDHLVMPAFTLALPLTSILVRLIRTGLIEVMNEDYIRTARSKGLSEVRVLGGHALKNMLIPVVTVAGLQLGNILGGAVVVETVFAWPGVGRLLVDAIGSRDYSVVQASAFLIAGSFVAVNLLVDLSYGALDPRVRES